ncbi:MAG TPA: AAC(3) family N-acetyltransferase [Anaerolineaceae bacterium]|nr:AAC(3) family N-acetyltransferase [Anaerolineaceae bacterium]
MITFRDIVGGLRQIIRDRRRPMIVHASLSSFGEIRGGAETLLGGLLMITDGMMMPAFTYKTMIIPEEGPQDNGMAYGRGGDNNRMAEFFQAAMPVDTTIGVTAETFRKQPYSKRSDHPILSFTGVNVEEALKAQTLQEPLAPIRLLSEQDALVLLLGVDHTVNTSIHYAERLAGRKQFIRWALTSDGVRECPNFPGCSDGFEQAAPFLEDITQQTRIGEAQVRVIPLQAMIECLTDLIKADPLALLCQRGDCERCDAVRHSLAAG